MPQQTKVTALVEQSRMIPMVDHIVVALLARVAYAMALTGFADVAIENHFSVDRHGDPIAHGADFLHVPVTERREFHSLGGNYTVNRTMRF